MDSQGRTLQDWTIRDEYREVDIVGLDNEGLDIGRQYNGDRFCLLHQRRLCFDSNMKLLTFSNCTTLVTLCDTVSSM